MTINYLAYGSNLFPPRLRARIPIAAVRGRVELPGFALEFSKRGADGSGKCNLRETAGGLAFGVVYSIAASDRVILDRIEGVGHGYRVETLDLAPFGPCHFYRALDSAIDATLAPFDWYQALVVAGARHHGFPADYIAAIAAVAAIADHDAARNSEHWRLLASRE